MMMSDFSTNTRDAIGFAAELIRKSKHTLVLTGAGISTPSGIPDFRSEGTGLWSYDEPLEVASLSTFRYHPERFFEWIRPLISRIIKAQPNPAHLAIACMEQAGFVEAIITQNIDNLHQKAGSNHVYETHGSLLSLSCTQCFLKTSSDPFLESLIDKGQIPVCPNCGSVLKPNVILFGEQMPYTAWQAAQQAARSCDLMLVAGSSLEVLPVAGLPMQALDRGAHLVIINQTPTYLGVRADVLILEDVARVIPAIAECVLNG
jgi:NAD-dependent deacetylase